MATKSDPRTWQDPRHRAGWHGEQLARCYLEACGWEVLDERCRIGRAEIDLVVRRKHLIVFVEVKLRRNAAFGSPLQSLGWAKKRDLSRAAAAWVDRREGRHRYRFDVVGITWRPRRVVIEHVEDAFRPGWR